MPGDVLGISNHINKLISSKTLNIKTPERMDSLTSFLGAEIGAAGSPLSANIYGSIPLRKTDPEFSKSLAKIDEGTSVVKKYFHGLLNYINHNDASLLNDDDGDLAFFINQMPDTELNMTFPEWIHYKKDLLKREFASDMKKKLVLARNKFDVIKNLVESLEDNEDNDELLQTLSKTLQ